MSDPFRLGSVLAFEQHASTEDPTAPWRTLSARIAAPALRDRVEHTRSALGAGGTVAVDARTAASTEQFGLVARLVAAQVCASALGLSLDPSTSSIWWRPGPAGLLQLSFARSDQPRDPLRHSAIVEVTDLVHERYGVSRQVLWGNVGSAANSTIALLRTARPDLVARAREAADRLLADQRIDGGNLRAGPGFRRRSCCLIYRATESLCGDCVLRDQHPEVR